MSIIGTIHEDVTTDILGHIGSWQWLVTFVGTALLVPSMLNQYEDMYLLTSPESVECDLPNLAIANSSICSFTTANDSKVYMCNKWHVKLLWVIWIKKAFLVFCDQELKILPTTIVCRLGIIFGSFISGLISDSFGRKRAITIDIFFDIGFRLILSFCDSGSWFLLIVFLRSLFASANFYMSLILICEISSNTWRTRLEAIVSIPRLLAIVCLVPLANSSPNMESFNFITCVYGAFLLILLRWTPESPQWLLYNRRVSIAEKLILKAAKMNGIGLCSDFKIRPVDHRAYECLDKSSTCMGILTTHNIRMLSGATIVFWCLFNFMLTSLYLRIHSSNHQYTLLKIFSFIIALGGLNWGMAQKLKLKSILTINNAAICVSYVTLLGIKWNEWTVNNITCMTLAICVIAQGLILNITPRLFAINIRATVFGCCQSSGQIGAIVCYIIFMLRALNDATLMMVEATVAVCLTFLVYTCPDVDGRELPDVLEDMDYFSDLSKPLRWATQKTNSPSHEEVEIRVYSFGSAKQKLSNNDSEERLPARRLGRFRKWPLLRRLFDNLLRKFRKKLLILSQWKQLFPGLKLKTMIQASHLYYIYQGYHKQPFHYPIYY